MTCDRWMTLAYGHVCMATQILSFKGGGGLHLFNKKNICPLCNCHNFFSLSSRQIILYQSVAYSVFFPLLSEMSI